MIMGSTLASFLGQASLSQNVLLIAFSCATVLLLAIARMLMVHPGM